MAPLPKPFDARAHWIREKLHFGLRTEAMAMIEEAVSSGKAGKETQELAEYLAKPGRGRPPFGTTYLWPEIGVDNDELREAGVGYEARMKKLGTKYQLRPRQVETAVAKYERAIDAVRAIDEENRSA